MRGLLIAISGIGSAEMVHALDGVQLNATNGNDVDPFAFLVGLAVGWLVWRATQKGQR